MNKKLYLLILWVMAAFMPAVAQNDQETLTVFDGDATNGFVPVYGFYADAYNKCQMIMPADDLSDMLGGVISKITWYLATPAAAAWGGNFQIYLSEVSQATFASNDFLDISGATLVYEGPLDGTQSTMEIEFTQDYTYDGGNLLISVYETETGSWIKAFFTGATVTGASISYYSYNDFEDIFYGTYRNFLPKTTFTYDPIGGVVHRKPTNLEVSGITTNSATITWDAGSDETSWGVEYKKTADEEWTSAGTVTEKTITLDALANGVKYDVRVKSIYADGESGWAKISFSTPFCEGEETDMTLTATTADTPNNANADNENEDYHKLFDKNKSTKWCVDNSTGNWETIWVDFQSNVAFIPTGYTMTTASDTYSWKGRNPKKWKIYAKAHEADDWTTIVDVTDGAAEGLGTANTTDYHFDIEGITKKYQYFRFEVSEVCDRGGWQNNHYVFQLAELALSGIETTLSEPSGNIVFSDLDVQDDCCTFSASYTGDEEHELTLMVNGEPVENPYTISRTQDVQTLQVEATVTFTNGYAPLTTSTTYEIPALEGTEPATELTFTPTAVYTPNNANADNENEDYHKLFDKDKSTKWCVDNSTGGWETIWVDFQSNVAFVPTGYTMTTAADTYSWKGRNPKKWKIYAKAHEADDWTTIVDVTDGATEGLGTYNTTDYHFDIDGITKKYQYFRFEVSEVCGRGGWQNNHYVFQLAELALNGAAASANVDSLPFVTTPSPTMLPIHWYQLKANDMYVYHTPNGNFKASLTSTPSTDDAYLWCFVEISPDSILIYNKSAKQYLHHGVYLTSNPNEMYINYVEAGSNNGFYVFYYNNEKVYHYVNSVSSGLAATPDKEMANLFNAIEVLVEEEPVAVTGDVNGDGKVDVSDVNIIINIMLGKAHSSTYPGNPDLNNDNKVDVSDVNAVINIMLGKE